MKEILLLLRRRRRTTVLFNFIIVIQAIVSVHGVCPSRWLLSNGDCYFFSTNKFSNSDAKSKCVSMGANLTSINDQSELDFIIKQTSKKDYWIGLYKTGSSKPNKPSYTWLDGSGELTVSSKSCSGASTYDCAVFAQKAVECNSDCTSTNRFICRRKELPSNATLDVLADYPDDGNDSTEMIDTANTYYDQETTINGGLSITKAPPTSETTDLLVSDVRGIQSWTSGLAVEAAYSQPFNFGTVRGETNRYSEELSLIQTSEAPTTCNEDLFVKRCSFPPDSLLLPEDLESLSLSDPIPLPDGSAAAYYVCRTGFAFANGGTARSAICQNGQWTKIHACQPIDCSIKNVQPLTVGQVALRTCNDSQRGNGEGGGGGTSERFADGIKQEDVKCVQDAPLLGLAMSGLPHRTTSVCSEIYCEAPPLVLNATLTMNAALRSATFTCWPGHRFSDGSSVKVKECNHDNSWNYDIGSCAAVFCEKLPTLLNGSLSTDSVAAGTIVTIQCNPGFVFDDGEVVKSFQCLETETWNATVDSICKPVFCAAPPLIQNASIEVGLERRLADHDLFPFDARLDYVCDVDGQRFPDGSTTKSIACDDRGNWNYEADLSCDYGRCDPVPLFDHAHSNTSSADKGTVVGYACDPGYTLSNTSAVSITCDGSSWSSYHDVQCNIRCPLPTEQPLNGHFNTSEGEYGTQMLVSCDEGYQLDSGVTSAVVFCTEYGYWSEDVTCTAVECGPVPVVMNSQMMSSNSMTYGTNVTVTCLHGYWFARGVVNMTMFCGADGNWTDLSYSSCTSVSCLPLAPRIPSTTNTSINTVVNVSCPDGHWLATKQLTIQSTCGNSGHWTPVVPDCIAQSNEARVATVFEADYSDAVGMVASVVVVVCFLLLVAFDLPNIRATAEVFRRNFLRTFNTCI